MCFWESPKNPQIRQLVRVQMTGLRDDTRHDDDKRALLQKTKKQFHSLSCDAWEMPSIILHWEYQEEWEEKNVKIKNSKLSLFCHANHSSSHRKLPCWQSPPVCCWDWKGKYELMAKGIDWHLPLGKLLWPKEAMQTLSEHLFTRTLEFFLHLCHLP
jgi:hypothetical protein